MKRWMSLLVLVLLLAGCGQRDMQSADTTQTPTEQEPIRFPLAAVQLPQSEYFHIAAAGDHLLVMGREQMLVVDGNTLHVLADTGYGDVNPADCDLVQCDETGVVFYERAHRMLHFWNESLQQISNVQLQEKPLGALQMNAQRDTVYYCTADGIRALDLGTGVVRTLTAHTGNWLGIDRIMFDDALLCCSRQEEDGTVTTCFISTINGETVREVTEMAGIASAGELYFCSMQQDGRPAWIYGWGTNRTWAFMPGTEAALHPLPEGEVVVTAETIQSGTILYCYDLNSGYRTASLKMKSVSEVTAVTWLNGRICFLGDGALYCWDPSMTPTGDKTVYICERFSENDPDRVGLMERVRQTQELGDAYGVNIMLWTNALTAVPEGFAFEVEYVPEHYDAAIAVLEGALARFPEGFFEKASGWSESGRLNIVLVKRINTPSETDYSSIGGMQYLRGGENYIVLALGEDLEQNFYHTMGHAVDITVMSNSNKLYEWSKLNPSGFKYDQDYLANLQRGDSKYLEGKNRYFIDTYSMSFPVEDRATIFAYAMLSENGTEFSSSHMQKKLQTLCDGIRQAFELTEECYPWEQYLK